MALNDFRAALRKHNPNMPLRGLLYFARLYEDYVAQNKLDIYGVKKLDLPTPYFIVFFNGSSEVPDVSFLRLSDLYRRDERPMRWKEYPFALDCVAVMLNINYGHNEELMKACRKLHDYAYFVQMVKDGQTAGLNLETAICVAVDECIEKNILADLLVKSRNEVFHMILTEFDEKAYKKRLYKDGVQDGIEQGLQQGIALLVNAQHRQGIPYEDTEKLLMEVYSLDRETAGQYMEQYWK